MAALAAEALAGAFRRRLSIRDMSAVLTGLLIGMAMPPGVALWIPAAAAFFAILVVKEAFGGLGSNWMNPALAGIMFSFINWPAELSSWLPPRAFPDLAGLSGSTPLGLVRDSLALGKAGEGPLALLAAVGMAPSAFDAKVSSLLNSGPLALLNAELPSGYIDLIIGRRPGSIGELSGILLLASSVFLISRRWIRWQIPAWMLGGNAFFVYVFGGLAYGTGFFTGDALMSLFSGSLLLVAFFMATDPVSSPRSALGMAVYGLGAGFLVFLLRSSGARAEGTAIAVLIMNSFVPLLERKKPALAAEASA
jgi:electron transport complex protein RnfD